VIEINLLAPQGDLNQIMDKNSESFKIISMAWCRDGTKYLFIVEAAEEEVTFLKLKYGEHNVWKR
jgi:hypothetical protein